MNQTSLNSTTTQSIAHDTAYRSHSLQGTNSSSNRLLRWLTLSSIPTLLSQPILAEHDGKPSSMRNAPPHFNMNQPSATPRFEPTLKPEHSSKSTAPNPLRSDWSPWLGPIPQASVVGSPESLILDETQYLQQKKDEDSKLVTTLSLVKAIGTNLALLFSNTPVVSVPGAATLARNQLVKTPLYESRMLTDAAKVSYQSNKAKHTLHALFNEPKINKILSHSSSTENGEVKESDLKAVTKNFSDMVHQDVQALDKLLTSSSQLHSTFKGQILDHLACHTLSETLITYFNLEAYQLVGGLFEHPDFDQLIGSLNPLSAIFYAGISLIILFKSSDSEIDQFRKELTTLKDKQALTESHLDTFITELLNSDEIPQEIKPHVSFYFHNDLRTLFKDLKLESLSKFIDMAGEELKKIDNGDAVAELFVLKVILNITPELINEVLKAIDQFKASTNGTEPFKLEYLLAALALTYKTVELIQQRFLN